MSGRHNTRSEMESLYEEAEKTYGLVDEGDAVRLFQEISRIPSVTGEEAEIGEFLRSYMQSKGLDARAELVQPNRPNVVATLKGKGDGVTMMIQGHMDTVPVAHGWTSDPYSGDLRDSCVYGQGSTDMKGGLAAVVVAAEAMLRSGLPLKGDLVIAAVMGHMEHGMGSAALLKDHSEVEMCVIAEPTDFEVCVAQRGWIYFDIQTRGKVAHTSVKSPNAVVQMAEVAISLNKLKFKMPKIPTEVRRLFPGPAAYLNVGPIRGGLFPNQVPDSCEMTVDVRPTYNKRPRDVLREIRDAITDVRRTDPTLNASVQFRPGYPRRDYLMDPSSPPVTTVVEAYKRVFRKSPKLVGKPWWSDAGILCSEGKIPTLVCGPGGSPYYLTDERLPVKDYLAAIKLYVYSAVMSCRPRRKDFYGMYGRLRRRPSPG